MKPSDLKIHVSGPKPDNFPIAEFLRLCERVSKGELDHLDQPARQMVASLLSAATDHITEQLSDEGQSEMMRMGASERQGGQG